MNKVCSVFWNALRTPKNENLPLLWVCGCMCMCMCMVLWDLICVYVEVMVVTNIQKSTSDFRYSKDLVVCLADVFQVYDSV